MIGQMSEWMNECVLACLLECRQHVGPARKDSGSGVLGDCGWRAEEEQGRSAGPTASQRVLLP